MLADLFTATFIRRHTVKAQESAEGDAAGVGDGVARFSRLDGVGHGAHRNACLSSRLKPLSIGA